MRLSPLDIQHMEFERSVSGYKRQQVRAFLERIASEREDLLKELQTLRDRVAERDARIEALQEAETDLRQAVISAERIANQIRENARQEAGLILREAESGMRDKRAEAEEGVRAARAELARLRNLRESFREQFRGMLLAFERSLDARADSIGAEELELAGLTLSDEIEFADGALSPARDVPALDAPEDGRGPGASGRGGPAAGDGRPSAPEDPEDDPPVRIAAEDLHSR